ncbi:MAG: hypothetical protein ACE5JP_02175 [Candidatus Bipolaricaulia bacterium]
MESFLEDIENHGWTEERRREFVERYDREIGNYIIYLLARYRFLESGADLVRLRNHVEGRLRGRRVKEGSIIDLISEAYVRTYDEIFNGNLVGNYLRRYRGDEGGSGFIKYLKGTVRNKLLDIISKGRRSEREILDGIVNSVKQTTVKRYIGEAKARFWKTVRDRLLSLPAGEQALRDDVERHIDSITDYFFEQFIPARYPAIRDRLERSDPALKLLLDTFYNEHYRERGLGKTILDYRGSVPKGSYGRLIERSQEDNEGLSGEKWLDMIGSEPDEDWVREIRLEFWDQLIRCMIPSLEETLYLRRLLSQLQSEAQIRDTKMCLACVLMKQDGTEAIREDLRIFLVYYLSNYGTSAAVPRGEPIEALNLDGLTLERIRGRRFSWGDLFQIFGKECNPFRVKKQLESVLAGL